MDSFSRYVPINGLCALGIVRVLCLVYCASSVLRILTRSMHFAFFFKVKPLVLEGHVAHLERLLPRHLLNCFRRSITRLIPMTWWLERWRMGQRSRGQTRGPLPYPRSFWKVAFVYITTYIIWSMHWILFVAKDWLRGDMVKNYCIMVICGEVPRIGLSQGLCYNVVHLKYDMVHGIRYGLRFDI